MKALLKAHHFLLIQGPLWVGIITVYEDYDAVGLMVLAGWLIYLVHFIVYRALVDITTEGKSVKSQLLTAALYWVPLIPFIWLEGIEGLKSYLFASGSTESIALITAIMFFMLFGKGVDGERAYKSEMMGVGLLIIVLLIFSGALYPYVLSAAQFIRKADPLRLYMFVGTIIYQSILTGFQLRNIRDASRSGSFTERDVHPGIIVGMIFGWIIGLGVYRSMIE